MAADKPYLDEILKRLSEQSARWSIQDKNSRIGYLKRMRTAFHKVENDWVLACCKAKGLDFKTDEAAEEWLAGPAAIFRNLRETIQAMQAGGKPKPRAWEKRAGQSTDAAVVFPNGIYDSLMMPGVTAEVWIQKGRPKSQGLEYNEPTHKGHVSLVLGAGNQASIPVLDAIYKLFVENEVVLLKLNPVNEYLKPCIEAIFSEFIRDGYFAVVTGDGEVGQYLCQHPSVESIHMTGASQTYNHIVWENGDPGKKRKIEKMVTAELGCVTPILVVPGMWSEADLDYHVHNIASMVVNNASFNCNAAKVIVTARDWPQRELFLQKFRKKLGSQTPRRAYYPGALDRYKMFLAKYPTAKALCEAPADCVPWTMIPNVPPVDNEFALNFEAFCGVIAELSVDAATAPEFLEAAVATANEKIFGTLSCGVIIDDETQKQYRTEFEDAIAKLRYGGVAVNVWPAMIYWLQSTTWGAYPGHTPNAISSGCGVVHNTFMFDFPEKSVVRAPFRIKPMPIYFSARSNHLNAARALTDFERSRSIFTLVKLAVANLS